MCGIIGYNGNSDAISIVINGLKKLEYRGYDSSGIAYFKDDKFKIKKEKGRISELEKTLDLDKVNLCIGHTRWATHGKPSKINAHPHQVGDVVVVHNGIIENYITLKTELEKFGYVFKSETDTEVACCLIDYLYKKEKDKLKVLNLLKEKLVGSYALLILFKDDQETIYAIKSGSPLIASNSEVGSFIASDIPAILDYTNKYYILSEGEIAVITSKNIKFYDGFLEVKKEMLTYDHDQDLVSKNNYEHFMLKEIHEQPILIKQFLDHYLNNIESLPDLSKFAKIHIVACGSAYHAGLVGKYLLEKYSDIEVNTYVASEYRYQKNFLTNNTLVILVSQSGETADTIASLRLVKEKGAKTLGIVNVVGSTIARESDNVIYLNAGCEIAVATTKAYTLQVLTFSLLAFKMGLLTKKIDENLKIKIIKDYYSIPKEIINLLNIDYTKYVKNIYNQKDIFFIGRLLDYYISLEGSLKLKEISYLHSETYPAGELKHGTISLIESKTPVISVLTNEQIFDKTISNVKEVKARGAYTIGIVKKNVSDYSNIFDDVIELKSLNEFAIAIVAIVPLQMLAYNVAKKLGYDIDKPRNLAKSVTVE